MKDNKFKELLMKKKAQGKVLSPEAAQQKMEVVKELMESMGEDMGERIKGMQKVTVAAPDKKGLKEGLEKASEVIDGVPEMSDMDEVMNEDDKVEGIKEEQEELNEYPMEDEEEGEEDIEALRARLAALEAKQS